MAKLARNPPSWKMVMLVLGVIAISLVLVGLEKFGFLPDWMSMERVPRKVPRF